MISTGNDIVALNAIDIDRTQQRRFYSKIITPAEKALYDEPGGQQISFVNFVWLAWSVKESAYKYLQRLDPSLIFSPTKILLNEVCNPAQPWEPTFEDSGLEREGFHHLPFFWGTVSSGSQTLHYRSLICSQLIFTIVNNSANFSMTFWGIKRIDSAEPSFQSKAVREFALKKLKNVLLTDDVHIGKSPDNYPLVSTENQESAAVPLSLAHHGNFVTYSFQLSN